MRKLSIRLGVILFFVGLGTVLSVMLDPYGVFHVFNQRDYIGLSTNARFVKICHLLDNPQKYDTLLFGSSRVGYIDVNLLDVSKYGNCYNMTYSAGTPANHVEDIRFLIKNGIIPKKILLGFDDGSISSINLDTRANLNRRPYPYDGDALGFYIDYLNPTLGIKAIINSTPRNLIIMMGDSKKENLYSDGQSNIQIYRDPKNWLFISEEEHAANLATIPDNMPLIAQANFDKAFSTMFEIKQLCEENNIELTFFTTPNHVNYFAFYADNGLLSFLSAFAKKADFINFLGVNNVTVNPLNYHEMAHYNTLAGDYVIKVLNGEDVGEELFKQHFGIVVGSENEELIISSLSNQAKEYLKEHMKH